MSTDKKIKSALISVYHKDNLEPIVRALHKLKVTIYSTGGTRDFIEKLGLPVTAVEDLTEYPSILGGRVKTLHPKIFGGILSRRQNTADNMQLEEYNIPVIDLVIVDLYPFRKTMDSGVEEAEIIEKIDIGGISLIRAAAKNFNDVMVIPSRNDYEFLLNLLKEKKGFTSIEERKNQACNAFKICYFYDLDIASYFMPLAKDKDMEALVDKVMDALPSRKLRYGENPHQTATFLGNLDEVFEQLHGKELSYNNLLDIDAALSLMSDFDEYTFAIIKHNNACGIASRNNPLEAWKDALAGDPVSAFGGVIVTNKAITEEVAKEMNKLFFEILIAPDYNEDALAILKEKKNRIVLKLKNNDFPSIEYRSILNGSLEQDRDLKTETDADLETVTDVSPTANEIEDMIFANKIVKHSKSNAIVLAKNKQLLASGVGQTSRVDALNQAIEKAGRFGFDLNGAVMASDAFFPFPDCVEIAHKAGITAVIQPGGSVRDKESIKYCNQNELSMVLTGVRHFKH
jgi:phosphoribosylaminoimidazolecarboxamide formyltransferase/IMP cyclohydrolase